MVGHREVELRGITPKYAGHIGPVYWQRALRGVGFSDLKWAIYNAAGNQDLVAKASAEWARRVGAPKRPPPRTSRVEDELARLRGDLVRRGR